VLCYTVLGFYERSFQHVQLYKSSVCLRTGEGAEWDEPNVQGLICAKIHELISSQAVYKFVAHSSNVENSEDALMVRFMVFLLKKTLSNNTALGVIPRSQLFEQYTTEETSKSNENSVSPN